MSRIGQDQRAQIAGAGRAEDPSLKSGGDQPGQIATVIQMCMGQDDGIESLATVMAIDKKTIAIWRPVTLAVLGLIA